jgi:hypothetical protein
LGSGLQYNDLPNIDPYHKLKNNNQVNEADGILKRWCSARRNGWFLPDSTTKPVNHKILTRLIKNQPFIVIMPKSIFLQP